MTVPLFDVFVPFLPHFIPPNYIRIFKLIIADTSPLYNVHHVPPFSTLNFLFYEVSLSYFVIFLLIIPES